MGTASRIPKADTADKTIVLKKRLATSKMGTNGFALSEGKLSGAGTARAGRSGWLMGLRRALGGCSRPFGRLGGGFDQWETTGGPALWARSSRLGL